jgi:putative transposase
MEEKIFEHIREQLEQLGCQVSIINGMPNHIHCLFRLSREKTIAEVMKQIKGSSSHFINQQKLIDKKFTWQAGYGVFSVSESALSIVHAYIKNQKPGISIPGRMES